MEYIIFLLPVILAGFIPAMEAKIFGWKVSSQTELVVLCIFHAVLMLCLEFLIWMAWVAR